MQVANLEILVTGATGFLGTALCGRLERDGHGVVRIGSRDADLTKGDALEPFSDRRFDRIVHLAAWTQAGDFCLRHPGEQWLINQKINTHVLDWAVRRQPQAKVVAMGTSCSYDPNLALVEENYLEGRPIESLFTYAMTKRMLYAGLLSLSSQFGLRYLHAVPSTLYGPGYHTDGRQMHFIFDLIRKIVRAKLYGDQVVLWGDGSQRRELVYLDDFVETLISLDATTENETFNIGAGEDHSIREFAEMICDRVGYDPTRIVYDETRYVGARSKLLDVAKLRAALLRSPRTPLAEGLSKTIDWFRENEQVLVGDR